MKIKSRPCETLRTAEVPCSTLRPTFGVAPQRCTYPQAIQKYYYILIIASPFSRTEQKRL